MKSIHNNFRRYIVTGLLLSIIGFSPAVQRQDGFAQESIGNGTRVILITKGQILQSDSSSGDEAILVTDVGEIRKLVSLFEGNRRVGHACSFHWDIWFWRTQTENYFLPFNEECEEYSSKTAVIHSTLKPYFSRLRQNPTHFVANLKVSASLAPDTLIQKLEGEWKRVFFLRDTNERLPFITIQSTAISDMPDDKKQQGLADETNVSVAKQILSKAISRIKLKYPVTEHTPFDNRYSSFGGGKIEHRVQTRIYFPYDTKLDEIESALENVKLLERRIPDSYFVQLIIKERMTTEQKRLFVLANPFVMEIFEYPRIN